MSRPVVVEGHRRQWQAPGVPFLGFLVSGFFLRTDCSRTALHTCKARASQVSIRADVEVVLGCLLAESSHAEAVTESAVAAA